MRVLKLWLLAIVLALAATINSMGASSAQTTDPVARSLPLKKHHRHHPEAQLRLPLAEPQQPAGKSLTVPAGGTWTTVHNIPSYYLGAPQLLTDGSVLFRAPCTTGINFKLTPDITGSYVNGTWSQIASLPVINGTQYDPLWYASEVLPDGRFIINGGETNYGVACDSRSVWTTMGAIYDPVANTWTPVAPPSGWSTIGDAQSVVLADGTYMLANCCTVEQALLNASNLTWTTTGAGKIGINDEEAWTLLPDGTVLTIDVGCNGNSERYDPASRSWSSAGGTVAQLSDCQFYEVGPQVLRPDGTVFVFGGTTAGVAHSAIYNPATGWSAGPDLPSVCGSNGTSACTAADAPAALLPSGNILFAAAPSDWPVTNTFNPPPGTHFFELSPANAITQVSDGYGPDVSSSRYHLVVLPTGQVLAVNVSYAFSVQVYTPTGSYQPNWQPVVTSVPSCVNPNGTYVASGRQLNGLSHGAAYGDDYQSNTNFPLIRIVNNGTGHVFYARTFNHSSRSVAPNASVLTSFKVPSGTELGASTLYSVANGIPSAGTPITVRSSCVNAATATHDFNGDGMSDIAWRDSIGNAAAWLMNGGSVLGSGAFGTIPTGWAIVGQRDFDGDGKHDWLWRNSTDGTVAIWLLNGLAVSQSGSLGTVPMNWSVAGTADFNGDGKGDILWRDSSTGTVAIWLMNGLAISQTGSLGAVSGDWVIVATGDFDGNGKADILWRNSSTGALAIWLMNGLQVVQSGSPATVPITWQVVGIADVDGDGRADILWRDTGTGTLAIWQMNGLQVLQSASLGAVSSNWIVALSGDFDGNGKSDILWRDTSGNTAIWFMNGLQIASTTGLGVVPTTWAIQSTNAD